MTEEKKEPASAEATAGKEEKVEAATEAPKAEPAAPAEAPAEAEVEVPKEFKDLVEKIEKMTVMELNSLVKLLEKKFGVSAAAVAVAGPAAGGEAGGGEEKNTFNVELKAGGAQPIQVIKVVKAVLGLGLKEAKDLVDSAPGMLKEGMKKEEAEDLKKQIEEAGGQVELK